MTYLISERNNGTTYFRSYHKLFTQHCKYLKTKIKWIKQISFYYVKKFIRKKFQLFVYKKAL